MPYPPRVAPAGSYQLVGVHAVGDELLFRDDADYDTMLRLLGRQNVRRDWECLSYCLMPNHVHLLVRPRRETLSAGMRDVFACYARRFNDRWDRRGHLVERRFWSTQPDSREHLYEHMRYIALNPVAAALVLRPEQWPWSSFAASVGLEAAPPWLAAGALLAHFDRDKEQARKAYRGVVEQRVLAARLRAAERAGSTNLERREAWESVFARDEVPVADRRRVAQLAAAA